MLREVLMALIYEPSSYRKAREERQKLEFPELEIATPNEVFKVDQDSFRNGLPLSSIGQQSVNNYLRLGMPDEEVRAIETETQQVVQGIHGINYLNQFRKEPQYDQQYVPSPVAIQQYRQNQPVQRAPGYSITPGFNNIPNPEASNVADYQNQPEEDTRSGFSKAISRAGSVANVANPFEYIGRRTLDPREVYAENVAAEGDIGAKLGPAGQVLRDVDTVTGLPIRTAIRHPESSLKAGLSLLAGNPVGFNDAFPDVKADLRTQYEREDQGGIGYGLEGAAPFEALRNIPGIEKDAPGTEISAFDTILGVSDALLDIGGVLGLAKSGSALRTYQQLTQNLPIGASLRNIGPDVNLVRATLNLPEGMSDEAVIAAAQQARPGIRAIAISPGRDPASQAVQVAKQQLDMIDNLLKNAPPPGALPPTQLGQLAGEETYVAIDRNTGRFVQHSNLFTENPQEATKFLTPEDAQKFAEAQPYPVDLYKSSTFADEAGEVVSRETPLVPRPALPPALSAPPAPDVPTPGRVVTGGASGPPGGVTRPPASSSPGLPSGPGRVTNPPTRTLDPLGNVPKLQPYEPPIIPQRTVTGGPQASALPSGSGSTVPGIGRINRAPPPDLSAFVDSTVAVSRGRQILDTLSDIFNFPRSLMSSLDHSFPGRQGIPFITRTAWWQAWGPSLRAWTPTKWSDYASTRLDQMLGGPQTRALAAAGDGDAIQHMAWVALKEKYGLQQTAFGDLGSKLSTREEGFVSRIASDLPGISGSERAYVTFGNELRDGLFKSAWEKAQRLVDDGVWTVAQRDDHMRETSRWINQVTGRGDLPARVADSDLLAASNFLVFSPRNTVSRFQVLGNILRAASPTSSLSRQMRLEIARDVAGYVGLGTLALYTLDRAGLVEVEWDSRSVDFAKGRIGGSYDEDGNLVGGQRYDPWAGFQPIARYLTQIGLGETKNSVTGDVSDIDGNPLERTGDLGTRFVRSKLGPFPSLTVDLLTGETIIGEPVQPENMGEGDFWINRFAPLSAADIYTAMQAEGTTGALKSTPAIFGIGFNQYQGSADVLDAVALRDYGVLFKNLPNEITQKEVRNSAEYQAAIADGRAERGDNTVTRDDVTTAFDLYREAKTANEADLAGLIKAGISGEALREAISDFKGDNYEAGQTAFGGSIGDYLDENADAKEGIMLLAEQYWSAPVPETVTESGDLRFNFDARDEYRDAVLREMNRLGFTEDTIVYTAPNGRTVNAVDYVLGTGDGTYRGERYDDETVRTAVAEYEQFQARMDDTGFFDLRDQAWVQFRESDPERLGGITDYWGWRERETLDLAQQYVSDYGYDPVSARKAAEKEVAGYNMVSAFNEFYRTEFRHQWTADFPALALQAMDFGYFSPDKAEAKALAEFGRTGQTTQGAATGSGFGAGAGFGSGAGF